MACDFHVINDHKNKAIVLQSDDGTAVIRIFQDANQVHVCIEQQDQDGVDHTRTDMVLGVDGVTQLC